MIMFSSKNASFKISTLLFILTILFSPQITAADNLENAFPMAEKVASGTYNTTSDINIYSMVGDIILVVLSLIGVIFIILMIYAGITWMTAAGNETNIDKAKNILKQSIIGLIIVIGAYTITYFIIKIFGSQLNL